MKPHALPPLHNFFLDLFFSLLLMGKSEKNNTYKNFLAYIFLTAIKPTRFDGFSIIAAQNNRLSKGEYPLGSGFPIGASSIPVGTRLSLESLVCYTFVEQMAAGNVAHPGKCGYFCPCTPWGWAGWSRL